MSEHSEHSEHTESMTTEQALPRRANPRPVKVTYLVIGLLFVGIAGIWLLGATDTVTADQAALWAPALLIVAGVVGLVASVANNKVRARPAPASTGQLFEEEDR